VLIIGARNGPDNHRKEEIVKNENRVLARVQARELTEKEIQVVAGAAIVTYTVCTISNASGFGGDGDPETC